MRKKLHDIMGVPPEYGNGEPPEYPAPPDEFNRFPKETEEEERPSRLRRIMLLLAAAGLVIVGVFWSPHAKTQQPIEAQTTAAPTAAPSTVTGQPDETLPSGTQQPQETPAPTPEPTPVVLTGKIHIVVYSDILDMDAAMAGGQPNRILADETFDAETFESYTLPPLPTEEGLTAQGYVLLAGSSTAYFDSLYFDNAQPRAIGSVALGDVVTIRDLAIVPLNDEGVREAEIHAVWLEDGSEFLLEFYDGELFGKHSVGLPMYSDGLIYLAAFPTPVREGLTFAGWCDEQGNTVDAVTYFDFFRPLESATSMEDRDWSEPIPCHLYALWSDGSGSEPVTAPPPPPDCKVIAYQTHSVSNAALLLTDKAHTTAVHVRLWEELAQAAVLEYDFTESDLSLGFWSEEGIDLNDFFYQHMSLYEASDEGPHLVLEAELTYRLDDGTTETVVRRAEMQPEEYVFISYDDDDLEENDYTFPGCFVASVFDTQNDALVLTADPDQKLNPGDICVTVTVDGVRIPPEQCRVVQLEDSYEYDGVQYTHYAYYLVMPRPNGFPKHGTALVSVTHQFLHYEYMTEKTTSLEY